MMYRRMTEESAFNFDATLFTCALFKGNLPSSGQEPHDDHVRWPNRLESRA